MTYLLDNRYAWVLWLAVVLGFFGGIVYVGNVEAVRKTGPAAGSTAFSSLYLTENVEDTGTQLNLTDTLTINPDQNASGDLIARGNGLSELFGVDVSAEQVTVHTLSDPDYGSLFAAARTTGGGADNDLVATLGEDDETSTVNSANTGILTNVQVQAGSVEANQSTTPDTVVNLRVEGTVTLDTNVSTDENFAFMVQDGPSWIEGTTRLDQIGAMASEGDSIGVQDTLARVPEITFLDRGGNGNQWRCLEFDAGADSNKLVCEEGGTRTFEVSPNGALSLGKGGQQTQIVDGNQDLVARLINSLVETGETQLTQAAPCDTCAVRRQQVDPDGDGDNNADTATLHEGPGGFGTLNVTDLTVASPPTPGAQDTGALVAHDGTGTPPPGLYSWRPDIGTGSWVHYSDTDEIGDQVITP